MGTISVKNMHIKGAWLSNTPIYRLHNLQLVVFYLLGDPPMNETNEIK